jgi:hypothetical protein
MMAGPIVGAVAAAAAPSVIESASDGLINKAFKIVMIGALLGVALGLVYAISLLGGVFDIGIDSLGFLGQVVSTLITSGPVGLIGAGLAGLGSLAIRR